MAKPKIKHMAKKDHDAKIKEAHDKNLELMKGMKKTSKVYKFLVARNKKMEERVPSLKKKK